MVSLNRTSLLLLVASFVGSSLAFTLNPSLNSRSIGVFSGSSSTRSNSRRFSSTMSDDTDDAIDAVTSAVGETVDKVEEKVEEEGEKMEMPSIEALKIQLLQISAQTDRGQLLNEQVAKTYRDKAQQVRKVVDMMHFKKPIDTVIAPEMLNGEWELCFSTTKLFRSSPFFQMIEAGYGDEGKDKAKLFFKLHELQTKAWGASSIGKVTQVLDFPTVAEEEEGAARDSKGMLKSAVDLIALPLTSVPLVGFWKLLPTFGGCIVTTADAKLGGDNNEVMMLTVDETSFKKVPGLPTLPGVAELVEGRAFPTADVVKRIKRGDVPVAEIMVKFIDEDMRIMEDKGGELFIYTRSMTS